MVEFDLLVVGGGSGGVACARRAAAHGARVGLVEMDRLGGTCVIRGCVPKKLMMYASALGPAFATAGSWGWQAPASRFDMAIWQAAKQREIDRLEGVYGDLLAKSGVKVLRGQARLVAPDTAEVGDQLLRARHIVLATGGRPSTDGVPGIERVMTSNDALNLSELPGSIGILGAGFIALEFACIFRGLGAQVAVFYRGEWPLRGFDQDLRIRIADELTHKGIVLHAVSDIRNAGAHWVQTASGRFEFDAVLNATGRVPNTNGLGLDALGLVLGSDGAIPVDAHGHTTVQGLHAIGDVTNRKNLTPVAIAEGRALADRLFAQGTRVVAHDTVASAVFTQPPIATVGLSEDDARNQGPLRIYEATFRSMKTAFSGGQDKAYMKLVVHAQTDRVLGIHMLGEDAPEIIQSLAVAYTMGATKADFDRTIAVHPTLAEEFVLMREPVRTD